MTKWWGGRGAPGLRGSGALRRTPRTGTRPGRARDLSYKLPGHDWIGYENAQPSSTVGRFTRFAEGCTPRELALFGVPLPGHPFWAPAVLEAMARRYPGLDLDPWWAALGG